MHLRLALEVAPVLRVERLLKVQLRRVADGAVPREQVTPRVGGDAVDRLLRDAGEGEDGVPEPREHTPGDDDPDELDDHEQQVETLELALHLLRLSHRVFAHEGRVVLTSRDGVKPVVLFDELRVDPGADEEHDERDHGEDGPELGRLELDLGLAHPVDDVHAVLKVAPRRDSAAARREGSEGHGGWPARDAPAHQVERQRKHRECVHGDGDEEQGFVVAHHLRVVQLGGSRSYLVPLVYV